MKDWKAAERRVAESLGGQRVPVTGRGYAPDIEHDRLSVEVKARAAFPAWLEGALRQAELSARGGKAPVVVVRQHGRRYRDALAVCRLSELAGVVGPRDDTGEKRGKHEGVTQR